MESKTKLLNDISNVKDNIKEIKNANKKLKKIISENKDNHKVIGAKEQLKKNEKEITKLIAKQEKIESKLEHLKEEKEKEKADIKEQNKKQKFEDKKPIEPNEIIEYLNTEYIYDENKSRIEYNTLYKRMEFNREWMSDAILDIIVSKIKSYFYPRPAKDKTIKSVINLFAKNHSYTTVIENEDDNWRNELDGEYNQEGVFVPSRTTGNYYTLIKHLCPDYEFSLNTFFGDTCINGRLYDVDTHGKEILMKVGNEYGGKFNHQPFIDAALYTIANEHSYEPFKNKLKALKWDGKERLKDDIINWFHTLPQYKEMYQKFTLKWYVGLINRIFRPGCTFGSMLIIITEGGTGKDLYLASRMKFFNDGIYNYFAEGEFKGVNNPDTIQKLQQNIVINFGEMKGFCNKDNEDTKAFMSRTEDVARFSYRRDVKKYPRHCVFYGSSNSRILFNDYTSPHERRYLPIESTLKEGENAKEIDIWMEPNHQRFKHTEDEYREAEYYLNQLWAEAYHLYLNNFNIGITDIDDKLFEEIQNRYMTTTVNVEIENIYIALNKMYKFDKKNIHGDWYWFDNELNWKNQINEIIKDDADFDDFLYVSQYNYINEIPLNWVKKAFNLHSNEDIYYKKLIGNEWEIVRKTYNSVPNFTKILHRITPKLVPKT